MGARVRRRVAEEGQGGRARGGRAGRRGARVRRRVAAGGRGGRPRGGRIFLSKGDKVFSVVAQGISIFSRFTTSSIFSRLTTSSILSRFLYELYAEAGTHLFA